MARPKKQTAEYFPHYVDEGRTKYILESKWGNDGYAFWFKTLEILCKSNGHYYDMSITANQMYLYAYMKLPEETVIEIIESLTELGNIDKELWEKRKIIWIQSLVDNLQGLYSKRSVNVPEKPRIEDIGSGNMQVKVHEAEKRIRKPREKTEEKEKYAEYVHMTEKEYKQLIAKYGEAMVKRMIEVLDNYKGSKGKTYKNDYRAILSWVVERVEEECKKKGGEIYGAEECFKPSEGF